MQYDFEGRLWLHSGEGAWVFVTLPKDISAEIKALTGSVRKGFGSIKVKASANDVTWQTSIFPDLKLGAYLLPIKRSVRRNAGINVGETVPFAIELVDT